MLLSNLFTLLGRLDAQGSARGREGRELNVHFGDQYVKFKVETLATLRPRTRPAGTKNEPMTIQVEAARWQHGEREERLFWSDGDDGKLENQAQEEAERLEREARLQADRDRITRLLGQVGARQQAQQIRAYVNEVVASPEAVAGRAFDGNRNAWAGWARTVADQLNPLPTAGMPGTVHVSALPAGPGSQAGSPARNTPDY